MNYELAKQLKDAGFPQKEPNNWEIVSSGRPGIRDGRAVHVYIPTLSELIAACGDEFKCLFAPGDIGGGASFTDWMAVPVIGHIIPKPSGGDLWKDWWFYMGKTPEEAVAKLYIALNKKQ